jgi:DNA-binding XRE family transcriptional regulator
VRDVPNRFIYIMISGLVLLLSQAITNYHRTEVEITLARKPNLARYLHEARIRRGLSVLDVAEQVGVTRPCVYFWETGRTKPRDANLTTLCKVLKLPVRATREMAGA